MKTLWESVRTTPDQCLRVLDLNLPAFAGPLHAHDALELTWIQSGEGLRWVAGSVEPFQAGDLVLVAPGTAHTWLSAAPHRGPARALVMQMVAHEGLERLPGWAALQTRLCKSETAAWVLGGRLKDELIDGLHAMLQRCELGQLGLMLALLSRCAQVLEGPAPAADGELRPLGKRLPLGLQAEGSRRQRIERLLRWIYENLGSPLAVSDAAGLLAVSPAAFSRTFRRAVGKPFNEYVNDLRIAQASLELLRSERPIAEIAQRCGYPTLSNFQHQFQQRHGIPPRQYRSALIPRSGNP